VGQVVRPACCLRSRTLQLEAGQSLLACVGCHPAIPEQLTPRSLPMPLLLLLHSLLHSLLLLHILSSLLVVLLHLLSRLSLLLPGQQDPDTHLKPVKAHGVALLLCYVQSPITTPSATVLVH
jgi:hypothetical protein